MGIVATQSVSANSNLVEVPAFAAQRPGDRIVLLWLEFETSYHDGPNTTEWVVRPAGGAFFSWPPFEHLRAYVLDRTVTDAEPLYPSPGGAVYRIPTDLSLLHVSLVALLLRDVGEVEGLLTSGNSLEAPAQGAEGDELLFYVWNIYDASYVPDSLQPQAAFDAVFRAEDSRRSVVAGVLERSAGSWGPYTAAFSGGGDYRIAYSFRVPMLVPTEELVCRSLSLRHDLSGRFRDVDARAVVPFNAALSPRTQYILRDVLGRQILQAWPVSPKVRRNEAEYGFETVLGRMARARPSSPLLREYDPPVTAGVMLEDVLEHFRAEFPWLEWEPLPVFAWYVTGGLIVPEIRAVQVTVEEDPDQRRTVAQILEEMAGAYFPEYAFTVSERNRLLVVPATFVPGYAAPVLELTAGDIREGGVFEEPSYTPVYNFQRVVNEAYDFVEDQVVLQPSAFIVKPRHWHDDTTGLPWVPGYAPEPPGTPWAPAQPDVGATHGLLGLETRELVVEGVNPRNTSYVPGGVFSFAVPVQPDTLIDSGTALEVDVVVQRWLQWRDYLGLTTDLDYDPEAIGTAQNLAVSVPGDGARVLLLDASGNWAGAAPLNSQVFRVYAAFDAAQGRLDVSVEWSGMTYRFLDPSHGSAVADAAVLVRIDGRGRKWAKSPLEISGSFGLNAQDYDALPGLAESQAEFGLQPGPLLTIRYFRLTPQQCAQIAEAVVRRSYQSRPRYRYELGPYGHVTPQMLNRAVRTPQGDLMRVTDYEMSVEYLPGEVRSSLVVGAEEVAPAVLFGALLLEDGGYLLFENRLAPVGGLPTLGDPRGALLLDEPQE